MLSWFRSGLLTDRQGKSVMGRPPSPNSLFEGGLLNAKLFAPCSEWLCASVLSQKVAMSAIPVLFFARRPSTILWRVVAGIVDAVYGMLVRWGFAHVGDEGGEVAPPLAYRDSTPAVVRVASARGSSASIAHVAPDGPCSGSRTSVRLPGGYLNFSFKATAATGDALANGNSTFYGFCSAVAQTFPAGVPMLVGAGALNHRKAPEAFSGKGYNWLSHFRFINSV